MAIIYADERFEISKGWLGKGLIVKDKLRARKHPVPDAILRAYMRHMDMLTRLNLNAVEDMAISQQFLHRLIGAVIAEEELVAELFINAKSDTLITAAREAFARHMHPSSLSGLTVYEDHNFHYRFNDETGHHFVTCKRSNRQARPTVLQLSILRRMTSLCRTDWVLTDAQKSRALDRCHIAFCASALADETDPTRQAFEHGEIDEKFRLIIGLI